MKRKPPIKELKERSALWIDTSDELRITLSKKELPYCCISCAKGRPINSWWFDINRDEWVTSFFTIEDMRNNYEFVGFI